jgi:two-component system NtrC family sensor kinase
MFLPGVKAFALVPSMLGLLILAGLVMVSLCRGRRNPTNYYFAGVCFLGALLNGNAILVSLLESPRIALTIYRLTYVFFVFTLPLYIQFTHAFLGITGRRFIELTAYGISSIFLVFVPSPLFFRGFYTYDFGRIAQGGPLFFIFAVSAFAAVLYCLLVLLYSGKKAVDSQQKNRIKYITGGLGLGAVLMSFNIFPVLGLPCYPMGNFNFIPAIVLAFGVLKYDLLDMGVLIRRGTAYFVLIGVLTAIYIVLIYSLGYLLMTSGYGPSLLALILAVTIVLLFDPLRNRIQGWLERVFYMGRYDYREILVEISGRMNRMHHSDEIRDLLVNSILHHLQLKSIYLIMKLQITDPTWFFGRGEAALSINSTHGLGEAESLFRSLTNISSAAGCAFLERALPEGTDKTAAMNLMQTLSCVAVVPLIAKDRIMGVLLLGEKKSGELLVHEDLEILMTMANHAVTAFENALSFERLEELNRNLERRITERTAALREALEEKERTTAQLIRSESLAAIGQLVAGTAHELNNPLASASSLIQSAVDTLKKPSAGEGEQGELIDDLNFSLRELKRAGDIVRSLLGLSRQTDNYREPIKVNDLIEDALRVLHNYYHDLPVVIEKRYETAVPEVAGNFSALGQVVVNILKNAFQALPETGGRITLSTGYDREAGLVMLRCRDTGHGMDERQIGDIFKPFFTTKQVGEGTGLGLYIAHELIKRHGGEILVGSNPGKETTFTIQLPCLGG